MRLRPPAVAGRFYPDAPERLRSDIQRYLDAADVESDPDRVRAIVVPHAGYPFSGPVAAHAFRRIAGKRPKRVVLLGPSHHFGFEGVSVFASGGFQTPLGAMPIDEPLAREIAERTATWTDEAHVPEHALEVELPFLQQTLGEVPIVPVLFGALPADEHAGFGRMLAGLLEPDDLVLISTDLSHYLDNESAHRRDRHSLEVLRSGDAKAYARGVHDRTVQMCGATAVVAGLACVQANETPEFRLLDYRTSGDVAGDTSRVVGYAAVTLERAA